jgi:ketosteroid isomerase-like protein
MTPYPTADEQIRLAREYFARVDAGDPSLLDMFTEDAQAYFPKFGTARGKAEFAQLVQGVGSAVRQFVHDPESMVFTQAGHRLVVEGKERGVLTDGTPWPGSARSEGRYCNVFEFRGSLISRLHIHADPDFAGRHGDLFPWR